MTVHIFNVIVELARRNPHHDKIWEESLLQTKRRRALAPKIDERPFTLEGVKEESWVRIQFYESVSADQIAFLCDMKDRRQIELDDLSKKTLESVVGASDWGEHGHRSFSFKFLPGFFNFGAKQTFIGRWQACIASIEML